MKTVVVVAEKNQRVENQRVDRNTRNKNFTPVFKDLESHMIIYQDTT